jgi:hypothetical protein
MASSVMLRRVAVVRTDVLEELSASIIRVTRFGEPGTTLAGTRNRRTLRRRVPPKFRFLQEPHGVTSQKMPFFFGDYQGGFRCNRSFVRYWRKNRSTMRQYISYS